MIGRKIFAIFLIISCVCLVGAGFGIRDYKVNPIGDSGSAQNISFKQPGHSITISENTTLTFTDLPKAGRAKTIVIEITNGDAYTITWVVSGGTVEWSGGTEPTWTNPGTDQTNTRYN